MTRINKNLVTILLLTYFVNLSSARPQRIDENDGEAEEAYYNSDDVLASDTLRDDQVKNDEAQGEPVASRDNHYKLSEQNLKDDDQNITWDNFSEMKRENSDSVTLARKDGEPSNPDERPISKRLANSYIESSETNEQSSRDMHDKRNLDGQTKGQDLRDLIIFDNSRDLNKMEKNMYKDNDSPHEDPRYQPYNQPYQEERTNKEKRYPARERRQSQETTEKGVSASATTVAKDSEAAIIKQQIQELNSQELEELLNSLSDDKKSLLKKILEDNTSENVNKREITKKAGTVEESNCVESSQIVLSDKQGGSLLTESPHTDAADITKDVSADSSAAKVSDLSNETKVELTNEDGQISNKVNVDIDAIDNAAANQQVPKSEIKRETNINDADSFDGPEEQSPDTDSEAISNDANYDGPRYNYYKREARDDYSEIADPMKSLEDSFPNPKSNDDSSNDFNMAPLVRVKRKDFENLKKRSANIVPNTNVAYVPMSEESEDENEEAGEFEDEGFNDQAPSVEKNYANEKSNEETLSDGEQRAQEEKPDKEAYSPRLKSPVATGDRENEEIGSDTDGVISGVEGVDENLMYAARNKRNLQHVYKSEGDLNRVYRTTPVIENEIQSASDNMNIGSYQENDAFGPLPRNYEGDLGRYKRVRHVKQK